MEQGECKSFESNLIKKCFSNTISQVLGIISLRMTTLRYCGVSTWSTLQPLPLVCPPQAVRVMPRHTPPSGAFLRLSHTARCMMLLNVFLHTSLSWESSTFLLSQQQLWPTLQSVTSSCSRSIDTLRPRKAYYNLIFTLLKRKLANTSTQLCCQPLCIFQFHVREEHL